MSSRMERYYKEDIESDEKKRTSKNRSNYDGVKDEDLENLNLTTNISIIDTDTSNLDLDKLKEYLKEHYSSPKRGANITELESEDDIKTEDKFDDTKEYDLKKVLEEAHKNKDTDYDTDRFKKIRETQYEILKNLDLDGTSKPEEEKGLTREETDLMNLIKTVDENGEKAKKNRDDSDTSLESDLMSDLMGDGNTEVLKPIDESDPLDSKPTIVEELEKTLKLARDEIEKKEKEFDLKETNYEEEDDEEEVEEEPTESLTITKVELPDDKTERIQNSFYTGKFKISKDDMDEEFEELEKEIKSGSIVIRILIAIIMLIVIFALAYAADTYFDLGLFKNIFK